MADGGTGGWYAACESNHGLGAEWFGPNRSTYDEAQADVDAHLAKNPDHSATVLGGP
jgi:hypothetical protein